MRYFHRTALSPDAVLQEADRFLGNHLSPAGSAHRSRSFSGTVGRITLHVTAEDGHYTLVTVDTDQVGESEADKLAKRLLELVHQKVEPGHVVRGAY
jgi:hypothetical protein